MAEGQNSASAGASPEVQPNIVVTADGQERKLGDALADSLFEQKDSLANRDGVALANAIHRIEALRRDKGISLQESFDQTLSSYHGNVVDVPTSGRKLRFRLPRGRRVAALATGAALLAPMAATAAPLGPQGNGEQSAEADNKDPLRNLKPKDRKMVEQLKKQARDLQTGVDKAEQKLQVDINGDGDVPAKSGALPGEGTATVDGLDEGENKNLDKARAERATLAASAPDGLTPDERKQLLASGANLSNLEKTAGEKGMNLDGSKDPKPGVVTPIKEGVDPQTRRETGRAAAVAQAGESSGRVANLTESLSSNFRKDKDKARKYSTEEVQRAIAMFAEDSKRGKKLRAELADQGAHPHDGNKEVTRKAFNASDTDKEFLWGALRMASDADATATLLTDRNGADRHIHDQAGISREFQQGKADHEAGIMKWAEWLSGDDINIEQKHIKGFFWNEGITPGGEVKNKVVFLDREVFVITDGEGREVIIALNCGNQENEVHIFVGGKQVARFVPGGGDRVPPGIVPPPDSPGPGRDRTPPVTRPPAERPKDTDTLNDRTDADTSAPDPHTPEEHAPQGPAAQPPAQEPGSAEGGSHGGVGPQPPGGNADGEPSGSPQAPAQPAEGLPTPGTPEAGTSTPEI